VYDLDLTIDLTLLLADFAQVAEGKLYISGAGWTFTSAPSPPMAIAVLASVPWDRANHQYQVDIELMDHDGHSAVLADGEAAKVSGTFEVGRPAGHPVGAPMTVPIAINVLPLALLPGQRYEWRASVDGETRDTWRLPFNTRPE
jgi:hypothetical protein